MAKKKATKKAPTKKTTVKRKTPQTMVAIPMSAAQKKELKALSKKDGCSMAAYVRWCVFGEE